MKKFLILSAILIFAIAPGVAWAIVASQPRDDAPATQLQPATEEELLNAIRPDRDQRGYPYIQSIASFERMEKWWYIVDVNVVLTASSEPTIAPMLVSKFDNAPDSINVVTQPGEYLPYKNISAGLGVPYSVIDKLNKKLDNM